MYKLLRPLLFRYDPEDIHDAMIHWGKWGGKLWMQKIFRWLYAYDNPMLQTKVCGISFPNPVGLAAGFDKNGVLVDFLSALGFGFLEIGSVTALPWKGNPKPRIFRLPKDNALINSMGLPNEGAENITERLNGKKHDIPWGINIAKTPSRDEKEIDDFCTAYKKLYNIADYVTLNLSCPNTPDGKTFEVETLEHLLHEIVRLKKGKPIFLKLSPDLSYNKVNNILELGGDYFVDGYVVGNTRKTPQGGLSGKPLQRKTTEMIRYIYKQCQPVIIGVGGIFSADDAYEKITAGAALVQVYTGLIYEGPGLVKNIKKGLVQKMKQERFSSLKDAVGSNR